MCCPGNLNNGPPIKCYFCHGVTHAIMLLPLRNMKVIAINEFGTTENFFEQQRDIPQPRAEEVLMRIRAGSFNPMDYKIRQGRFGGNLPMVLGHDAAGVIVDVGSSVSRLRVGDEVWAYLGGPCSNGAYAEYVMRPARICDGQASHIVVRRSRFCSGGRVDRKSIHSSQSKTDSQ